MVRTVWIASGERPKTTGKWEWPKKQTGNVVCRNTFRASISPKMYASSSIGVPWEIAKAPSTTAGPSGNRWSHLRFAGVSFWRVHIAACSATRLNSSPSSIPEQTLSWLPRMATSGQPLDNPTGDGFGRSFRSLHHHVGQLVRRFSFGQQRPHYCTICREGPEAVRGHPGLQGGRVAPQPDRNCASFKDLPRRRLGEGAASGGHHEPRPRSRLLGHLELESAKGRLSLVAEHVGDGAAGPLLDPVVHVEEIPAQGPGHERAYRALACPHEAHEHDPLRHGPSPGPAGRRTRGTRPTRTRPPRSRSGLARPGPPPRAPSRCGGRRAIAPRRRAVASGRGSRSRPLAPRWRRPSA